MPPLGGDRGALARLLSLIERGDDDARIIGRLAYPRSGAGYTVGLTGAPGAGKSTLTSAIIGHLRAQDLEIAVLAIDPSSPFTGGAILGDRVRMQDHATDPGVFIRSMATRGHLGGLSLGDTRGGSCARCDRPQVDPGRDRRRRPGRGRSRRQGRHDRRRRQPGLGRQRAGQQGRAHGDRRRLRDQQGRPQGCRGDRHAISCRCSTCPTFRTSRGDRRSSRRSARRATASPALWDAVLAHRAYAEASGELLERRTFRLREELREIVAQRLGRRARQICSGERWDELTDAVVDRSTTRGPLPTRCSPPSTPDAAPGS